MINTKVKSQESFSNIDAVLFLDRPTIHFLPLTFFLCVKTSFIDFIKLKEKAVAVALFSGQSNTLKRMKFIYLPGFLFEEDSLKAATACRVVASPPFRPSAISDFPLLIFKACFPAL